MPKKVFSFRLDKDLIADVDRLHPKRGERSDFVAAAISEKLEAGGASEPKTSLPGLKPDAEFLLAAIRKKRLTSRDAEKAMGWLGLRYPKAERQLIQAGLARIEGGVLVACASEAPA